jgi:hypothetical protein
VIDGAPVFDFTKFWFDPSIQAQFPLLCRVTIGILSVPVSSASSERVFMQYGRQSPGEMVQPTILVQLMLYCIHSVML